MKLITRRVTHGYEPADDSFHIRESSTGTNIVISRREAIRTRWTKGKFMRMLRVVDRLVQRS